jgi:hypothetical protein
MAVPTNKCPFKNNGAAGIVCENTACMAYNTTTETCKLIEVAQVYLDAKNEAPTVNASRINN